MSSLYKKHKHTALALSQHTCEHTMKQFEHMSRSNTKHQVCKIYRNIALESFLELQQ